MGKYGGIFGEKAEVLSTADKTPKAPAKKRAAKVLDELPSIAVEKSNRGRPAGHAGGKRSDPEFTQKLVYLRLDTLDDADTKLRAQNKGRVKDKRTDFSDLVQSLLEKWLNS